nr:MAG TPA: prohead serine protease [Caudoviricetes sp.]
MAKKTFILHDETVNTQGFRMLTSGADLSVFENNPVMLLNHYDWELPIGRWENIRIEGTRILADADFDETDERVAAIMGKVDRGYLKAASIGAWPPLETSSDPALMLPGQELPTVTRWIVREASLCTIGSNHNALALWGNNNKLIDLNDKQQLIKLFDTGGGIDVSHKNNTQMTILTGLLKLSDNASEQAIADEVRKIIRLRDQLQTENGTLKAENQALQSKVNIFEQKEKDERKAVAIELIDTAIKESRLDAKGKDAWLAMFDSNFDQAKAQLEAIPARGSVAAQVQTSSPGNGKGTVEMADMAFADIVKTDRLKELKREPELYKQKFFEAYGKYPA